MKINSFSVFSTLLVTLFLGVLTFSTAEALADDVSRSSVARDMAAGSQLVETLPLVEIMGPLAPIALSPFFGITCLSGAAILVDRGVLPDNAFLSGNAVLGNELTFILFLVLAVLTSLPRLTKVSKPIAQLADQLETWAVVIAFGVILFVAGQQSEISSEMAHAGFFSFSADVLIMIAVTLNIIVINTVRFFFEVLILLSPIPTVDALFEIANKGVVVGLMAVYIFSPTLSTLLNVIIFTICLVIFLSIWKRVRCWRSLLYGLIFKIKSGTDTQEEMKAFVSTKQPGLKKLSIVYLKKSGDAWSYTQKRSAPKPLEGVEVTNGLVRHTIKTADGVNFVTSRRYDILLQSDASSGKEVWKDLKSADPSTFSLS